MILRHDGDLTCWLCQHTGPASSFVPFIRREKLGHGWMRTKVTYYKCAGGCDWGTDTEGTD